MRRWLQLSSTVATVAALLVTAGMSTSPAGAAGASVVSGSVWQDLDRDGARDTGEAGFGGAAVQLYSEAGQLVTGMYADAEGRFSFGGLADGTYQVRLGRNDVLALREGWVPTTTGSISFNRTVTVAGSASGDLGLRPIVRSRTLGAPISSVRSARGTLVESYNDAVTAQEVLDHLEAGSLLGAEAPYVELRFDFQAGGSCISRVAGSPGSYSGYSADVWVGWLSWITDGDRVLVHEYGHAFANYHDLIVQQDGTYRGYLAARGLTGDARLGSSHAWDPAEMIAEDYRQLFGSPSAQSAPQENTDVPPASQVPGLSDYLRHTFTSPPSWAPPPPPPATEPAPTPGAALSVSDVAMTPQPLTTSGTGAFSLTASATVEVQIVDASGTVVRRLATGASLSPGTAELVWDRRTDAGRKARAGTYTFVVRAAGADGQTATGSAPFSVVDPTKTTGKPR